MYFKRPSDLLDGFIDVFVDRPRQLSGLPSGLSDLDAITGGFGPGTLTFIAGRPSSGKTAFLRNLVEHATLRLNKGVAVFTLEASAGQFMRRLVASCARVDLDALRAEEDERAVQRLSDCRAELQDARLWIDGSPSLSIGDLRGRAHELAAHEKLDLIVLDYLQMLSDEDAESRHEDVARSVRGLKQLALELEIPVVAASQVQRVVENRVSKRPFPSDLRESGTLEEVADLVIFIHRDEMYDPHSDRPGTAEMIVAKNRNGHQASTLVKFLEPYGRFANLPEKQ